MRKHTDVISWLAANSGEMVIYAFLLWFFSFASFCFSYKKKKKWKIRKLQKQCVYVYIGTCVLWMAIEIKFSKLCIFCSLDERLYA